MGRSRQVLKVKGETERFILWARDGGRIAEIEVSSFPPRAEVLLYEGRSFVWHEKTVRSSTQIHCVMGRRSVRCASRRSKSQIPA